MEIYQETIHQDDGYIFVKPICDFFEISHHNQQRKITNDEHKAFRWIKKSNEQQFGDNRKHLAVDSSSFLRWILGINPNIVSIDLKDKLIYYQNHVADFLYGDINRKFEGQNLNKQLRIINNEIDELKRQVAEKEKEAKAIKQQLDQIFNHYLHGNQTQIDFKEPVLLE